MTMFFRLLDVPVDDKQKELGSQIARGGNRTFDVDPALFHVIPGSPFSYWAGARVLDLFGAKPAFGTVAEAWVGLQTNFDFRWLRCWWESNANATKSEIAVPFAKGGIFSQYYADVYLSVIWGKDGRYLKEWKIDQLRQGLITANNSRCWNESHYFRPGLTWPRRTNGLSFRVMPSGCIFGDKGPGIFDVADDHEHLLALCAIANSRSFGHLVSVQLARTELAQSYEVGLIQRTPIPDLNSADKTLLAVLARRAWSLKRSLDTSTEASHAFLLPALLQVEGSTLDARSEAWMKRVDALKSELVGVQAEIDNRCFDLYGINEVDRRIIIDGPHRSIEDSDNPDSPNADVDLDERDDAKEGADETSLPAELASWAVGVAFGRFDVRLATGARPLPQEPEPFDPLRASSSAMLTEEDGQSLGKPPAGYPFRFPENGILVDDRGHERDLTASVRAVFDQTFNSAAESWWNEVAALLDPKDQELRSWLASSFFEFHLKSHSKSRRKAPILWQFAVPSGRYSIWLSAHRANRDSLLHIQNDIVAPKLSYEERQLASMMQSIDAKDRKAISAQESFVEELRGLLDEVKRVAPLWRPSLDDGIILTLAPLWRLVPQYKSWQTELKNKWNELVAGKHDWAHVAMHLWPERVVPKCAEDRSLAIAHGLEDVFWFEDVDGKWTAYKEPKQSISELVKARTSTAVKAALKSLLDAPEQASGPKRTRKAKAA